MLVRGGRLTASPTKSVRLVVALAKRRRPFRYGTGQRPSSCMETGGDVLIVKEVD